ncbi:enoyl-CoA hydratase/isomerase family protein [Parvularcula flava]|uniref:Enoyl-CoA hydratase/isomerase family protein n=1 Tax=Aquisalinus luteolus TaxID=1566827 RepID=A0A8J3A773_9PROT|nr:enoyl-CoA hydratase-related protein [Aquisalinus luteolus]NHK27819.1 enoyl-CoA hydratase/isomerase family protein [Aquisalinus luteolus]GGH96603.1 gamma-carboxygeranoyl-CoA hydratase [Aquisalinus luteolus]
MSNRIISETSDKGVVTLRLNRPEAHNAIDDATIDEMSELIAHLHTSSTVRAVVIRGTPDSFCSGVDIAWMQHMAEAGTADDARRVAHILLALRNLNKPTIAVLEGPCLGGGLALAACCDITIAAEDAWFALPAVHLGTVPAVIAPFVMEAMGQANARRYFLTGEQFSASEARRMGLVQAVCMQAQIEETVETFVGHLLKGAPRTLAICKEMLHVYADKPIGPSLINDMAERVVRNRKSAEAQEGLEAFLEKRQPNWQKG